MFSPSPVRPIPLPAGSLRPSLVGLLAAGRQQLDRRAHARTDGRVHGGPRGRSARAGATRPAREGWGWAQNFYLAATLKYRPQKCQLVWT